MAGSRTGRCRCHRAVLQESECRVRTSLNIFVAIIINFPNYREAFTLLAAMLTMRPWDDITSEDMNKYHFVCIYSDGDKLISF